MITDQCNLLSGVHGGSADRGVHLRRHDAHPLVALHSQEPQRAHPQVHPRHATGTRQCKQEFRVAILSNLGSEISIRGLRNSNNKDAFHNFQDPGMVESLSKNVTRQGMTSTTLNYLRVRTMHQNRPIYLGDIGVVWLKASSV